VRNEPRPAAPPVIDCAIHGTNAADCCLNSRPRDIRCTDQHIIRRARLKAKASFRKITDQIRAPAKAHTSDSAKPQTPPGENIVIVSYEVWTTVEEAVPTGTTSKTIEASDNLGDSNDFVESNDLAENSNNFTRETLDNSDLQCK
jgi:hypothetical protein